MTSSRQKMIDLSHLALLDSGDLSELPLFDEGQLDSFQDGLKKTSGPDFLAPGTIGLDLGEEVESEWLRDFNLSELPEVEVSFALHTLLEGCNTPTQAEEAESLRKPSPMYETVSYEDIKDPAFHHQGGQESLLSLEEVDSYLSEPTPSPDDSLSLQSVTAQEAFSPEGVHPSPAQIMLVAPLSPPSDSSADPPTPPSSHYSSELMELLRSPGEPKLTRSRATPYSRPGRKAKAVVKEEVDEDSCYPISKKDKKKIQNKNAAIRYRQKKKMEGEAIKHELDDLQSVNDELTGKVRGLLHEISYVKDLAKDVFERKGISFDIDSYLGQKMAEQK